MNFKSNMPRRGKRFKVPTILQMEATECGAACLGMILAYYRNALPLEKLRAQCGVSQHGASAAKIIKAAKLHGLDAAGLRCPVNSLRYQVFPMIILWEKHHFVVLEGIANNTYYLNDPAQGHVKLPQNKFAESYSHICLVFQPSSKFKPSGKMPPTPVQAALVFLRGNLSEFLYVSLVSLLLTIPALLFPFLVKFFIDDILTVEGSTDNSIRTTLFILTVIGVFLLSALLTALQHHTVNRLGIKIWLVEGARFIFHSLRLPLRFFQQRYAGDIALRSLMIEFLGGLIGGVPAVSLVATSLLLFYGAALLVVAWSLALGVFAIAALYCAIFYLLSRELNNDSLLLGNEMGKYYGVGAASLGLIEAIKANEATSYCFARISGLQANITNAQRKAGMRTVLISILPVTVITILNIYVLGYGGWLYSEGQLSAGELIAFQILAVNFAAPIANIIGFGSQLSEAKSSFVRINDLIEYELDTHYTVAKKRQLRLPDQKLSGNIVMSNVTFGYDETSGPLFENFSLTVKPKQRIAILGRSGCGKSTLAKLLCGLYSPWQGEICFDGQPLATIPPELLARSLSYVSQDVFFVDGSIRDNLNLWDNTHDEEAILAAVQDACIEEIINDLPGRLDYQLYNDGSNFSGGERQRLEIARALVSNPSLLVLDEATSALDPVVEVNIERLLRRRGCTCIVIAHRLSTVRDADCLLIMEEGRIIEQGTHEQLVAANSFYAQKLLKSGGLT